MRKFFWLLAIMVFGLISKIPAQEILAGWSFDDISSSKTVERISGSEDKLVGFFDKVDGVKSAGIQFDGFTSYLIRSRFGQNLPKQFTVNSWVFLEAYPWFRCPVFDLRSEEKEGVLLSINRKGNLTCGLGQPLNWMELEGTQLPLREWSMVSLVVNQGGASELYLNRTRVAYMQNSPVLRDTRNYTLTSGRNAIMEEWWDYQYTVEDHYSYLDGGVDEVNVFKGALGAKQIQKLYSDVSPVPEVQSQPRVLPAGPDGPAEFGANYTRLDYSKQWDRLWRVGELPDILVRFEESNCRLVFWRGTSFVPCWVTENGIWYTNEWTETWGSDVTSCAEPLMDRDCRFSHVRIIESTPARTVVHWRYALVDSDYNFVALDLDGQGEWTDEYYIIYPDGIGVRKIDLYYSNPLRKHDWEESIVLLSPGQHPDEVMDDPEVTLVNMLGETHSYSWRHNLPVELKEPLGANIHVVNFKSRYKPFYIVDPEPFESAEGKYDSPFFRSYCAAQGVNWHPDSVPSVYGWWNHWPVTPVPGDGRWVITNDRASHFNLTTFTQWKDYYMDDRVKSRIMLHGMTDGKPPELVALAKSWLQPPVLEINGAEVVYNSAERAYMVNPKGLITFSGTLKASEEHPAIRPAIILQNCKMEKPLVELNGRSLVAGKDFQSGVVKEIDGYKTIVWMNQSLTRNVEIRIQK